MNIWVVIYRVACVVLLVVAIIALIHVFMPGIRRNQERQRTVAALEAENQAREDMSKDLQIRQEKFMTDPKYVEQVAREQLGKAKAGETIFRFSDRKTNDFHPRR